MPGLEITLFALLVLLGWFWLDSLHVREAAVGAARSACEAEGLMLLDFTVAFAGISVARDDEGRVKLKRVYDFEYSDTGDNRRKGSVVMVGRRLVLFNVGVSAADSARRLENL